MKITWANGFMLIITLCMNMKAMERSVENMSMEEQFVNGVITIEQYLLSIENNAPEWGDYAAIVHRLRIADYYANGGTVLNFNAYIWLLENLHQLSLSVNMLGIKLSSIKFRVQQLINRAKEYLEQTISQGTAADWAKTDSHFAGG